MCAEGTGAAEDRTEIAWIGDAIQRNDQRPIPGLGKEILGGKVLVGRNTQSDALMYGAGADPVEVSTRGLMNIDPALLGQTQSLAHTCIHIDAMCDEKRLRRDSLTQRFNHAVAASDDI